jgi:hypothetical protein
MGCIKRFVIKFAGSHEQSICTQIPGDTCPYALLADVAASGVELEDERMRYVVVQLDRDVWSRIQEYARKEAAK